MIQFYEIENNNNVRVFEIKEDLVLGRAKMQLNQGVIQILSIDFFNQGQKYLEFFVRSLLNTVRDCNLKIQSLVYKDYLTKFGFTDGQIKSGLNINFTCQCKQKGENNNA